MKAIRPLFLLSMLILSSCGGGDGDGVDPCAEITCERGDCVEGLCECPPGWEGTLCDTIIFPSEITFKGITINMPDPPLSDTWDPSGQGQGADMYLTFFANQDLVTGYLEVSDGDVSIFLGNDVEGDWYEDPDFEITLPAADFYSVGMHDLDGSQYEFMEAAYLYFDFEADEEDPFPNETGGFGTFNGGNVLFDSVEYSF